MLSSWGKEIKVLLTKVLINKDFLRGQTEQY